LLEKEYKYTNRKNWETHSFVFYSDSTFYYAYNKILTPCNQYYSIGKWSKDKSRIILNSFDYAPTIRIRKTFSIKNNDKWICVDVNDNSKE